MESKYIEQSKQDFIELLIQNGSTKKAQEILEKNVYEPIYTYKGIHEYEETNVREYNDMVNEVYHDINALTIGFRDCAKDYYNLMSETKARLSIIKESLESERDKLVDVNILCNKYTDFSTVMNLTESDLYGSYSYENGIIASAAKGASKINYNIERIDGNGYEGNNYVYKDNKFISASLNTNNRDYIKDESKITMFEYSRITANASEKEIFQEVNLDSSEAKVTLTLSSKSAFNKIIVASSSADAIISSISVSDDNINYKDIMTKPISINETSKFDTANYMPGSGMLSFPSTYYVRLTMESNSVTDDVIAFEKTEIISDGKTSVVGIDEDDSLINNKYVYDQTTKEVLINTMQFKEVTNGQ